MRTVLNRIGLCVLVVAMGWPAAAGEVLTAHVRPSVALAPSDIVIRVLIEPNMLNRSVMVVADSGAYYSSSEAELEGERAPRAREVTFRMLPAGSYKVSVTLFGTEGERGRFVSDVELW